LACGDDAADDPTGTGGAGAGDAGAGGQGPGGGSGTAGGEGGAGGSGGHGGGDECVNTPSTPIAGDHCDAMAEATCSNRESCYPYAFAAMGNKAECLRVEVYLCEQTQLWAGTDETAAELKACAEKVVNATCSCTPDEVCGPGQYVGTLADGAACGFGGQCLGGFCKHSGSECGTCQTLVPAGGACDLESSPCVFHHYCDTSSGVCAPHKEPGSACAQSEECNNDDRHLCVDGICSPALGAGASCAGSNSQACDWWQGLSCRSGTCQTTPFSAPGGPCAADSTIAHCDSTGWCSYGTGICVARKGLNEACMQIADGENPQWDCLSFLSCIGGTCQQPVPTGTCP